MSTVQFKHKHFQNDPHMINSIDETFRSAWAGHLCVILRSSPLITPTAFILTVRGVTGATEQTHKFMGFGNLCKPMAARGQLWLVGFRVIVGHLCQSRSL